MSIISSKIQNWLNTRTEPVPEKLIKEAELEYKTFSLAYELAQLVKKIFNNKG